MIMGPCVPRGAVVVVSLQNCGNTKPCHKRHEPDVARFVLNEHKDSKIYYNIQTFSEKIAHKYQMSA